MNCPFCGEEMVKGTFFNRGANFFQPDGKKRPLMYTKKQLEKAGAIALPPDLMWGGDFPKAHLCDVCRKIVIDY